MNNMRYLFTTLCLVLLTGLAGITGSAIASTPDGMTPANEGVCDMLKDGGYTKGLYGLCVAYCEAQDLDTSKRNRQTPRFLKTTTRRNRPVIRICPAYRYPALAGRRAELALNHSRWDGSGLSPSSTEQDSRYIDNAPKTHFAEADTKHWPGEVPLCRSERHHPRNQRAFRSLQQRHKHVIRQFECTVQVSGSS